jgi:hypothetical protein
MGTISSKVFGIIGALAVVITLFLIMGKLWPVGADYFYTFRPVAEAWFSGQTSLYDHNNFGYFGAPWGIFLIAPSLLFPIPYGQALLTMFSLVGLVFSIYAFGQKQRSNNVRVIAAVLAIGNLHTFDMLIRGNIDAALVTGLGISYLGVRSRKPLLVGIGLWLLSVKPINVLLPMAVIIWLTRHWSRKDILAYFAPLAVTFLISLPLFGPDWPFRYLQYVSMNPPHTALQSSLWRSLENLGLERGWTIIPALIILLVFIVTLKRVPSKEGKWPIALSISTNLTITPYALGSHYILLAPVFTILAGKNKWYLALWLLALTPLSRIVGGFELSWIDILYPVAMMISCLRFFWSVNPNDTDVGSTQVDR